MAREIGFDCIKCGTCENVCPTGAISEGEDMYIIDPEKCMDCSACENVCPMGAVKEKEG